jgi:integrase
VPTVKTIVDRFAEEYMPTKSAGTRKAWDTPLRLHVVPKLGHVKVTDLPAAWGRFMAGLLAGGRKASTVAKYGHALKRSLSWAAEVGLIEGVPRLKVPATVPPDFRFLTFAQADALLAVAEKEGFPWYGLVATGVRAGLRIGELAGLMPVNVDLAAGVIHVRQQADGTRGVWPPKHGKRRSVPMTPALARILSGDEYRSGRWCYSHGDEPISHDAVGDALARMCKAADLAPIGAHVMRHTFASHAVMRGVPVSVVQAWMGHAKLTETQRYAHLCPSYTAGMIAVLDGAPAAPPAARDAAAGGEAAAATAEPRKPDANAEDTAEAVILQLPVMTGGTRRAN